MCLGIFPVCLWDKPTNCTDYSQTGDFLVHISLTNNCPNTVHRENESDILKLYIETQGENQQASGSQPELQDVYGKYLLIYKGKSMVGELTHGGTQPSLLVLGRMSVTFHY